MKIGESLPFSFFDAQGVELTNKAANEIVLESSVIPEGFVGVIKDNDTTFTTAGGGLDFKIKRASGQISKFREAITDDDSGFINKNLHEGDRVLITLNSTGVGIVDVIWDGIIKKVREIPDDVSDFDDEDEL